MGMTEDIYFNGQFVPADQAALGVLTHTFQYGTGVFEGIRAYWNQEHQQLYLLRALEHYKRMEKSASIMRLSLPDNAQELVDLTKDLLQRNNFQENVYIRPLAYKASQVIGCRLHDLEDGFLIYATPFGKYLNQVEQGVRCLVSSWRRVDDNAIPARAKVCGAYANSALIKTDAYEKGFDEAIVLNQDGHVAEGSAENIFIVIDGKLVTPPASDNILVGITRASIIELANKELGIEVQERSVDRTELYIADEVFLCGTGVELIPVVQVDHQLIGEGITGPTTQKLISLYTSVVYGNFPNYLAWCSPIYELGKTM